MDHYDGFQLFQTEKLETLIDSIAQFEMLVVFSFFSCDPDDPFTSVNFIFHG